MRLFIFSVIVVFGLAIGAVVSAYPGEYGTPSSPQPLIANGAWAHYDTQIHTRDLLNSWDGPFEMGHGSDCSAPPATHTYQPGDLQPSIFICNDHVMTTGWAQGYGEIVLTPSQLLDCSLSCSVTFDISTERQSLRDWWTLDLTPWADNLTLPFSLNDGADLQGWPKNGISVDIENGQSFPHLIVTNNDVQTTFNQFGWSPCSGNGTDGCTPPFNDSILLGVNQAAIRQTFKLTVTPGHLRFERLASPTATAIVFQDKDAPVVMRNDYVVQFEHHIYNPTKSGSGVPATWHWSNFNLSPAVPFTLINGPRLMSANGVLNMPAPAPSGAYLRFSAQCQVYVDGVLAQRQKFTGHPEHASAYFVPVAQGKQSFNIEFVNDGAPFCYLRDAAIWSKGGPPSTPTPSPSSTSIPQTATPSPMPSPMPSATPTATGTPTPSPTPLPVSTPTPTTAVPSPTSTPTPGTTRHCYLDRPSVQQVNGRWIVTGPEVGC